MENAHAVFREECPNCGGDLLDTRLFLSAPCEKCLEDRFLGNIPEGDDTEKFFLIVEYIYKTLKRQGTLKKYVELYRLEREARNFSEFFRNLLGNKPWSAQRAWAKRVLLGESFTILAPTGVGKTVFGIIMSLYNAKRKKKTYFILPTTVLVKQVYDKTVSMAQKAGVGEDRILAYFSRIGKKRKEELFEKLSSGDFDIFISTSQFLTKNFDKVSGIKFDLVYVDDVDSIMKSSKHIDKVLMLLGFEQDDINTAYEIIYSRLKLYAALRRNEDEAEELRKKITKLEKTLEQRKRHIKPGVLVISTATGRPRGLRIRLFRELLGFEIGSRAELLRNVVDTYTEPPDAKKVLDAVAELVGRLGSGGLVFVPMGYGEETLSLLKEKISGKGLRAEYIYGKERGVVEKYARGELDVLIGVATYYGILVRGLDLPHIIRYAVFAGVPHFKFSGEVEEVSPARLLQIASTVREIAEGRDQGDIDRLVASIRRWLQGMDAATYQAFIEAYKTGEVKGKFVTLARRIDRLKNIIRKYLSSEKYLSLIEEKTNLVIHRENGQLFFLLPDVMTYLQASGRVSRMYAKGVSKGLSVVVVDNKKLFENLVKMSHWYSEEIEWRRLEEIDLDALMREIDAEREFIRKLIEGKLRVDEIKDLVKTALVIVESPTKARTIAAFFGKPSKRLVGGLTAYETSTGNFILQIIASRGHMFDITTTEYTYNGLKDYHGVLVDPSKKLFLPVYTTLKRCRDCGEQFTDYPIEIVDGKIKIKRVCPRCGSGNIVDQSDTVNVLRRLAREVDEVLLATDPDTEGEKIAWDIAAVLKPYVPRIDRIEFHEVTRRAFEEALKNMRGLNTRLVEAQIVRRVEDRWIGFSLSKKLWSVFGMKWLSAGRVQTPVLGWVIERYKESKESIRPVFRIVLENDYYILADNVKLDSLKPKDAAEKIAEAGVEVSIIGESEKTVNPPPPYTTDTLLRDASQRLRIGVDRVMRLAQNLFELGLITYHRTDSTRVSDVGIRVAREYIAEKLGEEKFVPRRWGEGGAHECIRPTRPIDTETLMNLIRQGIIQLPTQLTRLHYRLYDMIFRRFIASQMPPAKVREVTLKIRGFNFEKELSTIKEVVEKGFTEVLPFETRPLLEPGKYKVKSVTYRKVPLVPLYSQADLIRLMKERGIGRPSTYAKIVKTLLDRHYVIEVKNGKLVPTKLGLRVYDYLTSNYPELVSEERTREVQRYMDLIEEGKMDYKDVLTEFYEEIINKVEK